MLLTHLLASSLCDNGQFIGGKRGRYILLDQNGKPISKTYKNKLKQVDKNRYLGWISYKNNEYVFMDEKGKELQTVKFLYGADFSSDGSGVYLYRQDDRHCVVIDYQGNKISTISREYTIGKFEVINGLIYIENLTGINDKAGRPLQTSPTYYLPNGTIVF